jgi:hypothetical protein
VERRGLVRAGLVIEGSWISENKNEEISNLKQIQKGRRKLETDLVSCFSLSDFLFV